jgi:hypothetical protein
LAKSALLSPGAKNPFRFLPVEPAAVRPTLDAEAEKLRNTPS